MGVGARGWAPALAFFALLLPVDAGGQELLSTELAIDNNYFNLWIEDVLRADRDYTHGTRLLFTFSGRTEEEERRLWEVEVGQKMYTPRERLLREDALDRPYAGWLYGTIAAVRFHGRHTRTVRVLVGVTGKPSLAEPTWRWFHRLVGRERNADWEPVIPFEVGVGASIREELRLLRAPIGAGCEMGVATGLGAEVGTVRVGVEALGAASLQCGRGRTPWLAAHIRGAVGYRLHDLFLDGSVWRESPSIDRNRNVGSVRYSVMLSATRFAVTAAVTRSAIEFPAQPSPPTFGTIAVKWHFSAK